MKVYGSLTNRLMEHVKQATPKVGDGATLTFYSDREAGTVIKVLTPRKVVVQIDKATRTDKNGMSESQEYSYLPDPLGAIHVFTLRKTGRWIESKGSTGVRFGERDKYHDFSF
jgi:hypothetical protein